MTGHDLCNAIAVGGLCTPLVMILVGAYRARYDREVDEPRERVENALRPYGPGQVRS